MTVPQSFWRMFSHANICSTRHYILRSPYDLNHSFTARAGDRLQEHEIAKQQAMQTGMA